MKSRPYSHLADAAVLRTLAESVDRECTSTSVVVALIGEVEARGLYVPAGHPSMHSYCVHVLGLSEDEAHKRLQAARATQEFPVVLEALATGQVHLTAVVLIKPHLTADNVDELLALVSRKTKSQIQELIAQRFPRAGVPPSAVVPALSVFESQLVPEPVEFLATAPVPARSPQLVPEPVPGSWTRLTPLSPEWSSLDTLLCREATDLMGQAFDLLGPRVRRGDVNQVVTLALREFVKRLQKQKFGASDRPRRNQVRVSRNPRHVPDDVKCQVWARDGGRCTFIGTNNERCPATSALEFDHIQEVARGGKATVSGIRLLCRAHNQYAAEQTFGADFMQHKREEARRKCAKKPVEVARTLKAAAPEAHSEEAAARDDEAALAREAIEAETRQITDDVVSGLRTLGYRADEAHRAAVFSDTVPGASVEERMRRALSYFHPKGRRYPHGAAPGMGTVL